MLLKSRKKRLLLPLMVLRPGLAMCHLLDEVLPLAISDGEHSVGI